MATRNKKDEKNEDEDFLARDLDTHFPLSGNETDDDLDDEETEEEDNDEDDEYIEDQDA